MGHKCSPKECLYTDEVKRTDDVIPVGEHGNVMLNYLDDTCVKTGDGCLYHFDMLSGDTHEIQQLKNNAHIIDYVDTYFEFFECTKIAPAIDPFEEFLDAEGSIFPFVASSEKPLPAPTEEPIPDPSPFDARSPTSSLISAIRYIDKASLPMPFLPSIVATAIAATLVVGLILIQLSRLCRRGVRIALILLPWLYDAITTQISLMIFFLTAVDWDTIYASILICKEAPIPLSRRNRRFRPNKGLFNNLKRYPNRWLIFSAIMANCSQLTHPSA